MNRLHPATMVVAFLPKLYDAFRSVLPFLAISLFSGRGDRTELFIAAIGVLGGFSAIATYLTTRYGIEGEHLVCTSGWLFKRDRRIPLDQIQNVNIRQGVLERILKVVTLEVETAASSGSELKLQVVTEEAAESLKSELALVSKKVEAPVAVEPESDLVYKMSGQDLLLGAMTENQGGQVIFGLIGTVGVAAMGQLVYRFSQFKQFVPSWVIWVASIAAIFLLWGIGWVYGGIQYAIKHAHFTVRGEPGLFRITHGLLTRLQYAVRIPRVEMASVSSTLWQRVVGRSTIRVGTAGSFGEQGTTVPVALMIPKERVTESLRRVLPDFDDSQMVWQTLPRYYFIRSTISSVIWLIMISVASYLIQINIIRRLVPDFQWLIPFLMGVVIVWTLLELVISYRRTGYALTDKYIASRHGYFTRTIRYMPISKIDTVAMTGPVWWQRNNAVKFEANGMVHSIQIPMIPIDVAEEMGRRITLRPRRALTLNLGSDSSEV